MNRAALGVAAVGGAASGTAVRAATAQALAKLDALPTFGDGLLCATTADAVRFLDPTSLRVQPVSESTAFVDFYRRASERNDVTLSTTATAFAEALVASGGLTLVAASALSTAGERATHAEGTATTRRRRAGGRLGAHDQAESDSLTEELVEALGPALGEVLAAGAPGRGPHRIEVLQRAKECKLLSYFSPQDFFARLRQRGAHSYRTALAQLPSAAGGLPAPAQLEAEVRAAEGLPKAVPVSPDDPADSEVGAPPVSLAIHRPAAPLSARRVGGHRGADNDSDTDDVPLRPRPAAASATKIKKPKRKGEVDSDDPSRAEYEAAHKLARARERQVDVSLQKRDRRRQRPQRDTDFEWDEQSD